MEWLVVGAKALGGIALLVAWAWLGWRLMTATVINGITFSEEDMESSAAFVAKAGDAFLKNSDTLWDLFTQHCPFFEFVLRDPRGNGKVFRGSGPDREGQMQPFAGMDRNPQGEKTGIHRSRVRPRPSRHDAMTAVV